MFTESGLTAMLVEVQALLPRPAMLNSRGFSGSTDGVFE